MEDLVRCDGWLVSFYDANGTFITLPFNKDGIDYKEINHIVKIRRSFMVKYPKVIQQEVVLKGVEREFDISTTVIVMNYKDLLPLLKSCLDQFNKIKIDSGW